MKLTLTGRKIEITDGIRNHLNNKMNKTISDLGRIVDIHVALCVEKHRHYAEIILKTKGFILHSHDETNDLYASIDKALEKMEKQLRKHKEKAKDIGIKQSSIFKNQYKN